MIIVPPHLAKLTYPVSRGVFRLFDAAETEKELVAGERFVLEEYVIDLLFWFHASHKEGTKQILSVPSTARVELLVVETVMGQLLKLPASAFKPVYACSPLLRLSNCSCFIFLPTSDIWYIAIIRRCLCLYVAPLRPPIPPLLPAL